MSDEGFFIKVKNLINSIIWDLPFENYHKYYKTGIIQKMSNQEKIDFFFDRNKEFNRKNNIKTLIILRPNILDDEDKQKFFEVKQNADRTRFVYLTSFFLNNILCGVIILRKYTWVWKYIIFSNIILLFGFPFTNIRQSKFNDELYTKYRYVLDEEKTFEVFKEANSID
jgi:hypothetical protein